MKTDTSTEAKADASSEIACTPKIKIPRQSPLKQIRKFCLDCFCGQPKEVRFCTDPTCAHWYLRFGKSPQSVIRIEGKEAERLFDPSNFGKGAVFGSEKYASSLQPGGSANDLEPCDDAGGEP